MYERSLLSPQRGRPRGGESRFLVSLTDDRPPLAAVAIGDLDAADNVTWAVPGMGSSSAELPRWARSSNYLQQAQEDADPTREHAVVAWVGYKAPAVGSPEVFANDLARAGGESLASALRRVDAARPDAQVNGVGYSYGTPTFAFALTQPDTHVDTWTSLGSAGLPASIGHAAELHADYVYAGQARDRLLLEPGQGDRWALLGRSIGTHPVNPANPFFGADVFGVDSGVNGLTAVTEHGSSNDSNTGYLDPGTESLWNVAHATTGHPDMLTDGPDDDPTSAYRKYLEGRSPSE